MKIFDKIAKKLNIKRQSKTYGVTNPIADAQSCVENEFLSKLSKRAVNLYERQCDVKNFTKLALSDPENTSHNELVEKILKEDVLDPLEDKIIEELANNEDLRRDLGL